MKVVSILGSPHKNGNTGQVLTWVEEEIRAAGHEVERVFLRDYTVEDCIACYECWKDDQFTGCVVTGDDANSLLDRMAEGDALIFATPLYCWNMSARLHALIDRGISIVKGYGTPDHRSRVEGKPTALVVTCGGSLENNADLVGPTFDRVCKWTKMKKVAELIVPNCTEPDRIGEDA